MISGPREPGKRRKGKTLAAMGRGAYDTTDVGTPDTKNDKEHDAVSWIACYDSQCATHRSEKEGSGYWPTQPKSKARELNVLTGSPEFQPTDYDYSSEVLESVNSTTDDEDWDLDEGLTEAAKQVLARVSQEHKEGMLPDLFANIEYDNEGKPKEYRPVPYIREMVRLAYLIMDAWEWDKLQIRRMTPEAQENMLVQLYNAIQGSKEEVAASQKRWEGVHANYRTTIK